MKKNYELLMIIHPDADEKQVMTSIEGMFADASVTKQEQDVWGLRTLAYPIEKQNRGRYILMNVESADPTKMNELNNELRIYDPIMRHVILAKE